MVVVDFWKWILKTFVGDPLPLQVQLSWLEKCPPEYEHLVWPLQEVRIINIMHHSRHPGGAKEQIQAKDSRIALNENLLTTLLLPSKVVNNLK